VSPQWAQEAIRQEDRIPTVLALDACDDIAEPMRLT
jgi:hypothetical protein